MYEQEKFNIDITAFETPDFGYKLSEKESTQLKENVLARIKEIEKISPPKKNKVVSIRRKFISFIAAALLLIGSTSAIASITNQIQEAKPAAAEPSIKKDKKNKKEKEKATENIGVKATGTSQSTEATNYTFPKVREKRYVKLECDYIDGYTLINKKDGWYTFEYFKGYNCNKNFDLEILYCDAHWSRDFVQQAGLARAMEKAPEYEQFYLEDKKAMYVKYPYKGTYTQQLFVQFAGTGYVFTILTGDGISKKELLSIGEKIRLSSCEKADSYEHVNFSEYLEKYSPDKLNPDNYRERVDVTNIAQMNQPVLFEGCEVSVENLTVYDNISTFTQINQLATETSLTEETVEVVQPKGMESSLMNNLNLFTDEEGNLLDYNRCIIVEGDGFMTPKEKILSETNVKQKFCVVQVKIKNVSENVIENYNTNFPLRYIVEEDGVFKRNNICYQRPVMEELCRKEDKPKYYSHISDSLTLEPQQEQIIQLGYFVDEDLLAESFLSVANSNSNSYMNIDIRRKAEQ